MELKKKSNNPARKLKGNPSKYNEYKKTEYQKQKTDSNKISKKCEKIKNTRKEHIGNTGQHEKTMLLVVYIKIDKGEEFCI